MIPLGTIFTQEGSCEPLALDGVKDPYFGKRKFPCPTEGQLTEGLLVIVDVDANFRRLRSQVRP